MLSKKLLVGIALLSCVAIAPTYSQAIEKSSVGMYGSVGGTGQFAIKPEFKVGTTGYKIQGTTDGTTYTDGYKPDYKLGYFGSISVGMPMSSLRLEVEGNYATIKVDDNGTNAKDSKFRITDSSNKSLDFENSGFSHWAGLFNVYYDAVGLFGTDNSIVPYIGAGAGLARIKFNDISRNAMAYQGKIGVTVGLSNEARFYAGYKYFAVTDGDKGFESVTGGTNPQNSPTVTKYDITAPYSSHGAEAGIMMNFSY